MRYFDASALVKRYVREKGSAKVRRLISSDTPATSRLSEVEVASALERLTREGAIARAERDRAITALDTDLPSIVVVELTEGVCARAPGAPARAGDAIQLAEPIPMVVFDDRLLAAARQEGLRVT